MRNLTRKEIEEILLQDFDLTPIEIDRYQTLFDDDYSKPRIVGSIKFINNKPQIFKDKEHRRNTILKKLKELHDPLLNVNSTKSIIQNIYKNNVFK